MTAQQEKKVDYLKEYTDLWKDIEVKCEQIEKLNSKAKKVTSTISAAPGTSGNKQDFTIIVDKIIKLTEDLQQDINTMLTKRKKIEGAINKIKSPLHKRVLTRKYINDDSFSYIAEKEGKSYKYIANDIHQQALDMLVL